MKIQKIALTKICLCLLFFACCIYCKNHSNDVVLFIASDELLIPENKELFKQHEAKYKNTDFLITGEIIFKEEAADSFFSRNLSCVYFGERPENPGDGIWSWNITIICYFDILTYKLFNDSDNVTILGKLRKIDDDGIIIFEKCRIVKPVSAKVSDT